MKTTQTTNRLLIGGMLLAAILEGFAQPVITRQPQNQSALTGTTATFSVEATGTPPWC